MKNLSDKELIALIKSVFPGLNGNDSIGILVDIPEEEINDNENWKIRRKIAYEWSVLFKKNIDLLGIKGVELIVYPDVGSNNADLPERGFLCSGIIPDLISAENESLISLPFNEIFENYSIFIAPTEFSTTAPLKNAAKKFNFRAATMPGFSPEMIPALRIDYEEVFKRVKLLKDLLDPAVKAEVIFDVDNEVDYRMDFDLRFRKSHLSSGRFPDKGVAGNLPSGETYIVPYEGELDERSMTTGTLPVQIEDEVLLYSIVENKAIEVMGSGKNFKYEEEYLFNEPAYGNMAELGFGVLGDFGLIPINEILLDEKLGFHVAFGRSDHFGGDVSPSDFSSPDKVIHLDRIYIKEVQPRISVKSIILNYPDGDKKTILKDNKYTIY